LEASTLTNGAGQLGQAPGDLGLADAGGAHHDDVLGRDLVAQVALDLLAAPAVAQRHGDRPLGVLLADDVAIELGDDGRGVRCSANFGSI
jgi:hypothetical protein